MTGVGTARPQFRPAAVRQNRGRGRPRPFSVGDIGVVSCHLSFGQLKLKTRTSLAQLRVCSHALLETRNGLADHCGIWFPTQPAQLPQTQPSSASAQPKRGAAAPVTVPQKISLRKTHGKRMGSVLSIVNSGLAVQLQRYNLPRKLDGQQYG
jgi:hypothetical protein